MPQHKQFDTSDVEIVSSYLNLAKRPPAVPLAAFHRLAHLRSVEMQINASSSVVR